MTNSELKKWNNEAQAILKHCGIATDEIGDIRHGTL